jgi:hypothetical protein
VLLGMTGGEPVQAPLAGLKAVDAAAVVVESAWAGPVVGRREGGGGDSIVCQRIDRRIPGNALLPVIALVLVAVLCIGGFLWWRMRPAPSAGEAQQPAAVLQLNEPVMITLGPC